MTFMMTLDLITKNSVFMLKLKILNINIIYLFSSSYSILQLVIKYNTVLHFVLLYTKENF